MITKNAFPILEFDTEKVAKLNPTNIISDKLPSNKLIITFFPEVINKLIEEKAIEQCYYIGGENPFPIYKFVMKTYVLFLDR